MMDLTFEEYMNLRKSDNAQAKGILACMPEDTRSIYEKYFELLKKFKIDTKKLERKDNNTMLTFDSITNYPQFRQALIECAENKEAQRMIADLQRKDRPTYERYYSKARQEWSVNRKR